jgi:4-hydroxybenzoate polyprenyltransferase
MAVMTCYTVALLLLVIVGLMLGFGIAYFIGLMIAEGIALYHYRLIKDRSREDCFKAFLHNNWFGAAVFAGVVGDYLVR